MIAFEAKPSWLMPAQQRAAAQKKGGPSRTKVSAVLLGGVVATLVAAGATPPAFAALLSTDGASCPLRADLLRQQKHPEARWHPMISPACPSNRKKVIQ